MLVELTHTAFHTTFEDENETRKTTVAKKVSFSHHAMQQGFLVFLLFVDSSHIITRATSLCM